MRTFSSTVNKLTLRRYGIHGHTGAINQARHSGLMNGMGGHVQARKYTLCGGHDNHGTNMGMSALPLLR